MAPARVVVLEPVWQCAPTGRHRHAKTQTLPLVRGHPTDLGTALLAGTCILAATSTTTASPPDLPCADSRAAASPVRAIASDPADLTAASDEQQASPERDWLPRRSRFCGTGSSATAPANPCNATAERAVRRADRADSFRSSPQRRSPVRRLTTRDRAFAPLVLQLRHSTRSAPTRLVALSPGAAPRITDKRVLLGLRGAPGRIRTCDLRIRSPVMPYLAVSCSFPMAQHCGVSWPLCPPMPTQREGTGPDAGTGYGNSAAAARGRPPERNHGLTDPRIRRSGRTGGGHPGVGQDRAVALRVRLLPVRSTTPLCRPCQPCHSGPPEKPYPLRASLAAWDSGWVRFQLPGRNRTVELARDVGPHGTMRSPHGYRTVDNHYQAGRGRKRDCVPRCPVGRGGRGRAEGHQDGQGGARALQAVRARDRVPALARGRDGRAAGHRRLPAGAADAPGPPVACHADRATDRHGAGRCTARGGRRGSPR